MSVKVPCLQDQRKCKYNHDETIKIENDTNKLNTHAHLILLHWPTLARAKFAPSSSNIQSI